MKCSTIRRKMLVPKNFQATNFFSVDVQIQIDLYFGNKLCLLKLVGDILHAIWFLSLSILHQLVMQNIAVKRWRIWATPWKMGFVSDAGFLGEKKSSNFLKNIWCFKTIFKSKTFFVTSIENYLSKKKKKQLQFKHESSTETTSISFYLFLL